MKRPDWVPDRTLPVRFTLYVDGDVHSRRDVDAGDPDAMPFVAVLAELQGEAANAAESCGRPWRLVVEDLDPVVACRLPTVEITSDMGTDELAGCFAAWDPQR